MDPIARRIIILGVCVSALALAYFYSVDHYFFSTRFMSGIFRYLLKTNDARTAWLSLGVCSVAACWTKPEPLLKMVDFLEANVVAIAIGSAGILALGALFVYHDNAFSMDEYAEVFQAKTFAAGHLSAHLPTSVVDWLVPPGFNGGFLIASHTTGAAIEAFWPGFSAILALFAALHVPWLCNPCLAGLAVILMHRITLDITHDRRAAGWAVFFALTSGVFVAYAISYYAMQARLTTNLLFAWLLLKPSPYRSCAAGIVGSLALVVHSPFPHALFAAPWIIALARSRENRRYLYPLIAGYLPLSVVVGLGWLHLRGVIGGLPSDLQPISAGAEVLRLPTAWMFDMRVAALVKMWLWAVPGLFLVAVLGRLRLGDDERVRLLMQSAVATFVGYLFVAFDQGHGWGYRYFQSAWGVVPILAGCALIGRPNSRGRLAAFAGAAGVLNLLLVVPYQMMQIERVITRHSAQLPAPRRPGSNVYFIQGPGGFYIGDLVQMDPLLRGRDLILSSRGAARDAELRRQNWPAAVLVEHTAGVDEWSVGNAAGNGSPGSGGGEFALAYSAGALKNPPAP